MRAFFKIWGVLLLVFVAGLAVFQTTFQKGHEKTLVTEKQSIFNEEQFKAEAAEITSRLEKNLILDDLAFFRSRLQNARPADRKTRVLWEDWVEGNPKIISVSFRKEGAQYPFRVLKKNIWSEYHFDDLEEDKRKELYTFLFQQRLPDQIGSLEPAISLQLPAIILGYPVLSIIVPQRENGVIEPYEVKISMQYGDSLLFAAASESGFNLTLLDDAGNPVFDTGEELVQPDKPVILDTVIQTRHSASISKSFSFLPGTLQFTKELPSPVKVTPTRENTGLLIYGAIGFVVLTLVSLLLALWVNRPTKTMREVASEMGRGNFSVRLPEPKRGQMKHLARLFNYMAEEMEHLQQLNVGGIISEKKKTDAILRNIADAVVVTDPADRILVFNIIAEKWFGKKEKDVLKKSLQKTLNLKQLNKLIHEVKNGRSRSSTDVPFRMQGESKDCIFQAHAARVQNQHGDLIGIVTVIRDVTQERELDQVKTELVSMVAHELKSPLASIFGFSELLLESNLEDPQAREYSQVIMNESTRLTDLVNKFLDISRLESGRTQIQMSPFDLNQVIQKLIDTFKGQAEKKDIRIITEIPRNIPFAYGDQDMIEQVLLNLLSNAVKYSPSRSKVGIEVKSLNGEIEVDVIDNGYGIPEEAVNHIFDKFYRVSDTEGADDVEGSGLGLALAKEIIQHHGGDIFVKSRLGVGSVFTFTLPKVVQS